MVCEFLTPAFKKKLLEIAEIKDLRAAGYTKKGAYNAKETGMMSDERCERLVHVLGEKALPIIEEALREFGQQVAKLDKKYLVDPQVDGVFLGEASIVFKVLNNLSRFVEIRPKWGWREMGKAFGTVLKGTFDKKDLDVAVRIALQFIAMIKGSRSDLSTFNFASEFDAKEFEAFANSLIETTTTKLSVERSDNIVKLIV
jgi:hypothetical protein